ncbi:MAG: hypothetical protein ABIV51_00140 [Saprospiraceae bacterium]
MNLGRTVFYIWLVICCLGSGSCKNKSEHSSGRSGIAHSDSLFRYFDSAAIALKQTNDPHIADSISQIGVELAEATFDKETILAAYNAWFDVNEIHDNQSSADVLVKNMRSILPEAEHDSLMFVSYMHLSDFYLQGTQMENANLYCEKAEEKLQGLNSKSLESVCKILRGKYLDKNAKKAKAYQQFLSAVNLAEQASDTIQLKKAYSSLSQFCLDLGYYDKAFEARRNQLLLIKSEAKLDSMELVEGQYEMLMIQLKASPKTIPYRELDEMLKYADQNGLHKLKDDAFALYRSFLVENLKTEKLYNLYHHDYPQELLRMQREDSVNYLRCNVLFYTYLKKDDSVEIALNQLVPLLTRESNLAYITKHYFRTGQYYYRKDNFDRAKENFEISLNQANEGNEIESVLANSAYLDTISRRVGDYKTAYQYAKQNRAFQDSMNRLVERTELALVDVRNENVRNDQKLVFEAEKLKRDHTLQYTIITALLALVFIFLVMLGRYKVPAWSIRMAGFFAFIFLFEFLILIADVWVHNFTHGEPWKILFIKVILVIFLLPLHHWVEKKVTKYLVHRSLIDPAPFSMRKLINRWIDQWKKEEEEEENEEETIKRAKAGDLGNEQEEVKKNLPDPTAH